MPKIGNYSINPELKKVSLDKFKKLVGSAFNRIPEKDREEEIKKAYEEKYGKIKENSKSYKEDRRISNSRESDSKE